MEEERVVTGSIDLFAPKLGGATLEEARRIAEEAWERSKERNNSVKKKCRRCFTKWYADGRDPEKRPPVFALDFRGCCPVCGDELYNAPPS
ncbi:MAG: hypothetical protein FJZ07_02240 [Candidatus Nealsonbacteria bacterium]|nr:hypothetical protein [Candidatus Nealsonbacteria bacterium]